MRRKSVSITKIIKDNEDKLRELSTVGFDVAFRFLMDKVKEEILQGKVVSFWDFFKIFIQERKVGIALRSRIGKCWLGDLADKLSTTGKDSVVVDGIKVLVIEPKKELKKHISFDVRRKVIEKVLQETFEKSF